MKGRINLGFLAVMVFGWIIFSMVYQGQGGFLSSNNTSTSNINLTISPFLPLFYNNYNPINTTTIIPITMQQNTTYTIEMRNGKLLYCKNYEKTDCGLMLSGCTNNAKYNCLNGTVRT